MERYCGFLKRNGVRNRRRPYASLNKHAPHVAQLNITKIKYGLVNLLSLTGPAKADGDIFPEHLYKLFFLVSAIPNTTPQTPSRYSCGLE